MSDDKWHIRVEMGADRIPEVVFRRKGEHTLARVDVGRMNANVEEVLMDGPPLPPGWEAAVPELWRGRQGSQMTGIRWLELLSPRGERVVFDFYRGLAPHDLARAFVRPKKRKKRNGNG